jgi:hypothetical protein
MKLTTKVIGIIAIIAITMLLTAGCTNVQQAPTQSVSDSGVAKATATVQTDANGHTLEQTNIMEKYRLDNDPATIRFVYLISPQTNKVMLKMTMKGKVTSSGKRLTPNTITNGYPYGYVTSADTYGSGTYLYSPTGPSTTMPVIINGKQYFTSEVTQDDGTYGSSSEYLYGFSMDGSMQQIYTGGATVIVSTKPLTIQDGVLNMQYVDAKGNPIADIPAVNSTKI